MKFRLLLIASLPMFAAATLQAQVLVPQNHLSNSSENPLSLTTEKRAVPYVHIREADLMWAKRIWRVIDLREKMNQMYFFPAVPNNERINLITLVKRGIEEGRITPYDPIGGDDFQVPMDRNTAVSLGTSVDTVLIPSPDPPYDTHPVAIVNELDPGTVKQFKVKEDWFFDSKRSVMEVRIIAICPVMEVYDKESGELRGLQDMYWIDFTQARDFLAEYKIYNPYNFAQRISYDDAFRNRMFASLIYKEDNTHDRRIDEYMAGIDALYEAEDKKNKVFEYEHDLWEY